MHISLTSVYNYMPSLYFMFLHTTDPAWSHGQRGTGTVYQEPWSADQFLQGQSSENLGRPITSVYTEVGRHVS